MIASACAPPAPVARIDGGGGAVDPRRTELDGGPGIPRANRPVRSRRDDDVAPCELRGRRSSPCARGAPGSADRSRPTSSPSRRRWRSRRSRRGRTPRPRRARVPVQRSHDERRFGPPDPCRLIRAAGCDAVARRVERNDDHLAEWPRRARVSVHVRGSQRRAERSTPALATRRPDDAYAASVTRGGCLTRPTTDPVVSVDDAGARLARDHDRQRPSGLGTSVSTLPGRTSANRIAEGLCPSSRPGARATVGERRARCARRERTRPRHRRPGAPTARCRREGRSAGQRDRRPRRAPVDPDRSRSSDTSGWPTS